MKKWLFLLLVAFRFDLVAQDTLLHLLTEELERQAEEFEELDPKPYYLSFKVDEVRTNDIQTDFGGVTLSDKNFVRMANVDIRIGSYQKDNTSAPNTGGYNMDRAPIPIDNEANGVSYMMWLLSDLRYKVAKNVFNALSETSSEGEVASFSKEKPAVYYEAPIPEESLFLDEEEWENRLKSLSGLSNEVPNIIQSVARLSRKITRKYFLDTEGSSIVQNQPNCLLSLSLKVVDKSKNQVPISKTFSVVSLDQLPSEEELKKEMKALISLAEELIDASYVEPYSGPVLLSGPASAVFFHEVLGHRIEAERLTKITDGQTFVNKLGTKILPKKINIKSLPSITEYEGVPLTGSYVYDDQGVRAQDVLIAEEGVLKQFLMSRKPMKSFSSSNGHGRSAEGGSPVTRQSNLIIESSNGYSNQKLRELLIKECKKQDQPFGYFIDQVEGGYTTTDRYQPNTINISPMMVYKVFVDGRPDELVKGMNLTGTPLNVFSEIMAMGSEFGVFNGYCGAESGYIPVSAVSPGLLIKKMEVQRKPIVKTKLPILSTPTN